MFLYRSLCLSLIISCVMASGAHATSKVSSPYITKGKKVIEYRLGVDQDDKNSNDVSHAISMHYGLTDTIRPELRLFFDNPTSEATEFTGWHISNRWQFLKQGVSPVTATGDIRYRHRVSRSDRGDVRLILGRKDEHLHSFLNFQLSHELGANKKSGLSFQYAGKIVHPNDDKSTVGVEFFANRGRLKDSLSFDEQRFQIGPVWTMPVAKNNKIEFGYLHGISDAATDHRIKFIWAKNF